MPVRPRPGPRQRRADLPEMDLQPCARVLRSGPRQGRADQPRAMAGAAAVVRGDATRAGSKPADDAGARLGIPDCCCFANMVKQKWSRSVNDGKAWRCRCGNVNKPTKHHFFSLPAFNCSQCGRELKLNFKFCLGEIEANGKSVVGEVWDQEKKPYCVAFAYGKLAEMTERSYNIKKRLDPDTVKPIDPCCLQRRFNEKFPDAHSVDAQELKPGAHKVLHMGLILRSEGIQRGESNDRYIAADVSTIARDDFEMICRYLADGIPLLATYWAGKRRGLLGYCKMYKSPHENQYPKGAPHIGHAVVLIGAGIKNGKRFFYFLNSWGKKFCPRKNKKGETVTAGIGKIREGDLTKNVVMLSHPNETGGERRLEDQLGMHMSNRNYLLMKATSKQWSAQKFRQLRLREEAVSLDADGILSDDDSIFSDDEGDFSRTTCAIHQGCAASFGSLLRFRPQWEYQGIARAMGFLNSRPAAIQMTTNQSCTTNGRPLMNQPTVANERPLVNQTPVANERPQVNQTPAAATVTQTPVASLVSPTPAANGRHLASQPPASNRKTPMNRTSVANGSSLMTQVPAANEKPVMSQRPATNGRSQMNQIHIASAHPYKNKRLGPEVHPAPISCPAQVADPKLKLEEGKMKALPKRLTDSRKTTWTVASDKEPRRGLWQRGTSLLKKWRPRSTPLESRNETDM